MLSKIPELPFTWKAGLFLFGLLGFVLAICAAFVFAINSGESVGRLDCQLSVSQKANEQYQKSQDEILKILQEKEADDAALNEIPENEIRPSDPVIRQYYERLRR